MFTQAQLYAYEIAMITRRGGRLDPVLGVLPHPAWFRGRWPSGASSGMRSCWSGRLLQVLGFQLNSIHAIPGGLWEVFIGVWLIVKGFSSAPVGVESSAVTTESAKTLVSAAR